MLSLLPSPPEPLQFTFSDKAQHALAFAVLMGWFMQIYDDGRRRLRVALALLGYGVAIEILQWLNPPRSFELADMVADAVGVAVAWAVVRPPLSQLLLLVESRLFRN